MHNSQEKARKASCTFFAGLCPGMETHKSCRWHNTMPQEKSSCPWAWPLVAVALNSHVHGKFRDAHSRAGTRMHALMCSRMRAHTEMRARKVRGLWQWRCLEAVAPWLMAARAGRGQASTACGQSTCRPQQNDSLHASDQPLFAKQIRESQFSLAPDGRPPPREVLLPPGACSSKKV